MKKIFFYVLFISGVSFSQQIGDPDFRPPIFDPAYAQGKGSKIYIDEAHNNFHTMEGHPGQPWPATRRRRGRRGR